MFTNYSVSKHFIYWKVISIKSCTFIEHLALVLDCVCVSAETCLIKESAVKVLSLALGGWGPSPASVVDHLLHLTTPILNILQLCYFILMENCFAQKSWPWKLFFPRGLWVNHLNLGTEVFLLLLAGSYLRFPWIAFVFLLIILYYIFNNSQADYFIKWFFKWFLNVYEIIFLQVSDSRNSIRGALDVGILKVKPVPLLDMSQMELWSSSQASHCSWNWETGGWRWTLSPVQAPGLWCDGLNTGHRWDTVCMGSGERGYVSI